MDAAADPLIETIVVMSSAQVGKTEMINNLLGYHIDRDPCPMLIVQPTIAMAETWSKDRLAPMIRDTPSLCDLVKDPRSRDSGNTVLAKQFPGGQLAAAGANSPASLASRPIRLALLDEVDRFPPSAGTEGDPVKLAIKRTTTFWNRKILIVSTPTTKGASRIEAAFEESDQRFFEVPCPTCASYQVLQWGQLKFDRDDKERPINVRYECEHCKAQLTETDKHRMVRNGQWVANRPWVTGTAGFHLSEMYSPWSTWKNMVENFLEAKKRPETLRVFINTSLGETWEEEGTRIDDGALASRREPYTFDDSLDENILLLTAGADVQDDRIEVYVKGWGLGEESWLIGHAELRGNPETSLTVWKLLDDYLLRSWASASGHTLRIAAACIDSGGHATQQAYQFCRKREARRVWAIKGCSGAGLPIIKLGARQKRSGVALGLVGVDTAKGLIFSRLELAEFGPGYMHFPKSVDEEYFKQLTAEKLFTKYVKGVPTRVWKKVRARNEALDCEVYSIAAFASLNANLERISARVKSRRESIPGEDTSPPINPPKTAAAHVEGPTTKSDQLAMLAELQTQTPPKRGVRPTGPRKTWATNW
jgi:phage terminase large subunit GpA-like protein